MPLVTTILIRELTFEVKLGINMLVCGAKGCDKCNEMLGRGNAKNNNL